MEAKPDLRLEVKCRETVDRGYGRQSRVIFRGSAIHGPYVYSFIVSQPLELEHLPRSVVGVKLTVERFTARHGPASDEDPPRPAQTGPPPRKLRRLPGAA